MGWAHPGSRSHVVRHTGSSAWGEPGQWHWGSCSVKRPSVCGGPGGGQPRNCWGPLQLWSESRGLSREGEGTTRHWVFPTIKATESEQWRGDRAEPRGGP